VPFLRFRLEHHIGRDVALERGDSEDRQKLAYMKAIHADNVTWKAEARGVREAKIYSAIHASEETRIDMVEVPAGSYIPPHRHSARTEFITILASAGAQLQIGERIFRPIAGQVFHREPGDILALTNDSQHPFCYSVVRFRYEASDVEHLGRGAEVAEQVVDEAPEAKEEVKVVEEDVEVDDEDVKADKEKAKAEEDVPPAAVEDEDSKKAKSDKAQKSKKSKDKKRTDSTGDKSGSKKSQKKSSKSNKKKK
jgi:quercetin dioxygenase-like cupin family protein